MWPGVLRLGYAVGISIFLLVSNLSGTGFIRCIVVLVWEKTCSPFTFLALITFPSCPGHLSLKSPSLPKLLLSQKLFHTSSCSYCPPPALRYHKVFTSRVNPGSACVLFSHLFSLSLPAIPEGVFAALLPVKLSCHFRDSGVKFFTKGKHGLSG